MYKLPQDIIYKLKEKHPQLVELENKEKYPGTNFKLEHLINDIFVEIMEKAIYDGSCLIRSFGTFVAFKVFSNRTKKEAPRFKFKISLSLNDKLKTDQHIIDSLISSEPNKFDEKHEEVCKEKRHISRERAKAPYLANQQSRQRTEEKINHQTILEILDKDGNE